LEDGIITMMAFSGILLIFSVAGSLYILKSYKVTLGHANIAHTVKMYFSQYLY